MSSSLAEANIFTDFAESRSTNDVNITPNPDRQRLATLFEAEEAQPINNSIADRDLSSMGRQRVRYVYRQCNDTSRRVEDITQIMNDYV
jgi:hypothetical protein